MAFRHCTLLCWLMRRDIISPRRISNQSERPPFFDFRAWIKYAEPVCLYSSQNIRHPHCLIWMIWMIVTGPVFTEQFCP